MLDLSIDAPSAISVRDPVLPLAIRLPLQGSTIASGPIAPRCSVRSGSTGLRASDNPGVSARGAIALGRPATGPGSRGGKVRTTGGRGRGRGRGDVPPSWTDPGLQDAEVRNDATDVGPNGEGYRYIIDRLGWDKLPLTTWSFTLSRQTQDVPLSWLNVLQEWAQKNAVSAFFSWQVAEEELTKGRTEYAAVSTSYKGDRREMDKNNCGQLIFEWWTNIVKPVPLSPEECIYYMIRTGYSIPSHKFTVGIGSVMNYQRFEAWFRIVTTPAHTEMSDVVELFFHNFHRRYDATDDIDDSGCIVPRKWSGLEEVVATFRSETPAEVTTKMVGDCEMNNLPDEDVTQLPQWILEENTGMPIDFNDPSVDEAVNGGFDDGNPEWVFLP
eukprot:gene32613-17630_t